MICQRSGSCCVTMMVIIPVKENGEWRAKLKPGDVPCPHMTYEGTKASCAVHEEEIFQGSPCWIYGNSYVDPDYIGKRGKPCPVGKLYQNKGGFVQLRPKPFEQSITTDEMEDLGAFPSNTEMAELGKRNRLAIEDRSR